MVTTAIDNPKSTASRVEFVLDLVCVHSYLGLTRFSRAAAELRAAGHHVAVTFLPFQLQPDAPAAGEPLREVHRRDFGERADEMVERMTKVGARDGLVLAFDRAIFVNTFEAHRLLVAAGRAGLAEPMAERLFRGYLTDGSNIGDAAVLERLAADVGLPPAGERWSPSDGELRATLARVRASGVRTLPTVRVATGPSVVPEAGGQGATTPGHAAGGAALDSYAELVGDHTTADYRMALLGQGAA